MFYYEKKYIIIFVVLITLFGFISIINYFEYDWDAVKDNKYLKIKNCKLDVYKKYDDYMYFYTNSKENILKRKYYFKNTFSKNNIYVLKYITRLCGEKIIKTKVVKKGNTANIYLDLDVVCGACSPENIYKTFKINKKIDKVNVYSKIVRKPFCLDYYQVQK